MADVPHAYPPTFKRRTTGDVRQQLRSLGMAVSNVNAFTHFRQRRHVSSHLIEDDAGKRQLRIDHTIACVELAAEFVPGR